MRAEIEVPETPALPAPAFPNPPLPAAPATGFVHAGLINVVVLERVGSVGADEIGPTASMKDDMFGNGTGGVELTPRLASSNDPNGIPVRAAPPGTVGVIDVGLDDAAMLFEPEPHIPDIPDVSSTPDDPKVTGISDVTEVADDVDVPDAVVPDMAAVAGAAVPTDVPPPSKLVVDPNISEGGVATVGHAVLAVVVGIVIVPVTPAGTGLRPGEVISVEPSGIPAGEPAEPVATPSGEVASIVGVGLTVPSNCPPTCAIAALQKKSIGKAAPTNENLIGRVFRLQTTSPRRTPVAIGFETISVGARLSDIGQFLRVVPRRFGKSAANAQLFQAPNFAGVTTRAINKSSESASSAINLSVRLGCSRRYLTIVGKCRAGAPVVWRSPRPGDRAQAHEAVSAFTGRAN